MGVLWAAKSVHLALLKLGASHQGAQQHCDHGHAAVLPAAGHAAHASQVWLLLLRASPQVSSSSCDLSSCNLRSAAVLATNLIALHRNV